MPNMESSNAEALSNSRARTAKKQAPTPLPEPSTLNTHLKGIYGAVGFRTQVLGPKHLDPSTRKPFKPYKSLIPHPPPIKQLPEKKHTHTHTKKKNTRTKGPPLHLAIALPERGLRLDASACRGWVGFRERYLDLQEPPLVGFAIMISLYRSFKRVGSLGSR